MTLSPDEAEAVGTAVRAAEARTDGEIVVALAERSDAYHDVALHYALAAVLLVAAAAAAAPQLLSLGAGGWGRDLGEQLFALLIAQAVVFLMVRLLLAWRPLRLLLTPRATKARRVRRAAVRVFRAGARRGTAAREAVVVYLSLDERMAEIVADAGVHRAVPVETWGAAMAALVAATRDGRPGDGLVAAVEAIGTILAEHVPKSGNDVNELSDRLVRL